MIAAFSKPNLQWDSILLKQLSTQNITDMPCYEGSYTKKIEEDLLSLTMTFIDIPASNKFTSMLAKNANLLIICYDVFDEEKIMAAYSNVSQELSRGCQVSLVAVNQGKRAPIDQSANALANTNQWQMHKISLGDFESINAFVNTTIIQVLQKQGIKTKKAERLACQFINALKSNSDKVSHQP